MSDASEGERWKAARQALTANIQTCQRKARLARRVHDLAVILALALLAYLLITDLW